MKRLILLLAAASVGIVTMTQAATFESAREAIDKMRLGWNLGNTLDSNSGDTLNMWIEHWTDRSPSAYETAWGQKVATPEVIAMFKKAGFNAIRVPVTWYPHMEAKFQFATYQNSYWYPWKDDLGTKIQAAWMARVKEVVDYVISQDMYCILNVHHDTGAANTAWLIADEDVYAKQHTRFEAIWTQIAETFRDYDEHLLFEGYNEMLDAPRSWCFASFGTTARYDAAIATSAYNAINAYAQSFVNAVRATGGNNAQRNLVVSTYGACDGHGNWNEHLQDPLKQMRLPNDPAGSGHLIFEVHTYPDISNLSWVKTELRTCISDLKRYLVAKGAPVIFGEWGSLEGSDYDKRRSAYLDFARYFVEQCKAAGIGTFYWMGLSDGEHRTVPEFNQPDLLEALVKGYYGEGGYVGVEELQATAPSSSAKAYSISGQLLPDKAPKKGLRIVNGKKILFQ